MANGLDKLETFDYKNWKAGRKFIYLESNETLQFTGIFTDPQTFAKILVFKGKNDLRMVFSEEFFSEELTGKTDAYDRFEVYTGLIPLSIGDHNFLDPPHKNG